jgi:ectoine hydroxylase-related dioxygenase (phytanoyl-CoA dioxygenase family)
MREYLYHLRTAGYTVLKNALDRERVFELRACIDKMLIDDDASWGAAELEAMGQRGALRNLCDQGQAFEKLLADSPVYDLLDEALGSGYILHSYDGLVLLPHYGRFPWDFHTDLTPLTGIPFPPNSCLGINCLYYLDDATAINGATWLVPASHRSALVSPPLNELAEIAFQAVGEAGDVLVFDARLWHCAGENHSDSARRIIKALFCQPWIRPQMDYSRAIRSEVRARLDARTLRLIGVGVAPPADVAELRQALAHERNT